MRRRVEKPRIVLLDCNLEYKKGESQTAMEIVKEEDFTKALQMEEAAIRHVNLPKAQFLLLHEFKTIFLSCDILDVRQDHRRQARCHLHRKGRQRPRATFPHEGEHNGDSPPQEDRQQPSRQVCV